jgi:hypothetical protein
MGIPLPTTKPYIPPLRQTLILCPRLIELLDEEDNDPIRFPPTSSPR